MRKRREATASTRARSVKIILMSVLRSHSSRALRPKGVGPSVEWIKGCDSSFSNCSRMFLSQKRVDVERLCNRITKAWRYVCKLSSNRWEELAYIPSVAFSRSVLARFWHHEQTEHSSCSHGLVSRCRRADDRYDSSYSTISR